MQVVEPSKIHKTHVAETPWVSLCKNASLLARTKLTHCRNFPDTKRVAKLSQTHKLQVPEIQLWVSAGRYIVQTGIAYRKQSLSTETQGAGSEP